MASTWLAAYLQATTTRQKPVAASEHTNQVIVNNANCLVQAQLAGGARFRTVNPVVSYSPVRYAPGGTSKPLKSAWGVFLRKSKIDPKSAFSAGGGKGALAAWGSHMRLVSTK